MSQKYELKEIEFSPAFLARLHRLYPRPALYEHELARAKHWTSFMMKPQSVICPGNHDMIATHFDGDALLTFASEISFSEPKQFIMSALQAALLRKFNYSNLYDVISKSYLTHAHTVSLAPNEQVASPLYAAAKRSMEDLSSLLALGLCDPNQPLLVNSITGITFRPREQAIAIDKTLKRDAQSSIFDVVMCPIEAALKREKYDKAGAYTKTLLQVLDSGVFITSDMRDRLAQADKQGFSGAATSKIREKEARCNAIIGGDIPGRDVSRQDLIDAYAFQKIDQLLGRAQHDKKLAERINTHLPELPLWMRPELTPAIQLVMRQHLPQQGAWSAMVMARYAGQNIVRGAG